MSQHLPLVGVSACRVVGETRAVQRVSEKYVTALTEGAGVCPVLIPALEAGLDIATLVERLDGIFLTGSPSNVEPDRYEGGESLTPDSHDHARDGVTIDLIRAAIASGVPLFGVCRGIQEINVALGGSLLQAVHENAARLDHRMRRDVPYDWRYRPAHSIAVEPGGLLDGIVGPGPHIVNSLHGQALDRLGEGVVVEARAPDGVVEAISIAGAPGFALAVQWHPEWPRPMDGLSRRLFEAFGAAVRAHSAGRGVESVAETA